MSDQKKPKQTLVHDDVSSLPRFSRRLLIAGAGAALGAAMLGVRAASAEHHEPSDGAEMLTDDGLKDTGDKSDQDKDASKDDVTVEGAEILTDEGIKIED